MDLIVKHLYMMRRLERGLEFLNVLRWFIFARQHADRDVDVGRFRRVNHCRVAFGAGFEGCAGLRGQGDDFAAPAQLRKDDSISFL